MKSRTTINKAVVLTVLLFCAVDVRSTIGEVVTLQQPSPVEESDGTVEVCVELTGVTGGLSSTDIEVNLTASDGSATMPSDYDPSNDTLTVVFLNGTMSNTTVCTNITIVGDDVLECDHYFTVEINSTSPSVTIDSTNVTVTIKDTDDASSVTVAFEQSTYNVSEGDGTTQVCVEVSGIPAGGLECEIMVTLTTMDNTAVLNEDFTVADPLMVTIPTVSVAGSTACANITILDDDVLEFEHDFTVQLSNTVPAGVVLGALMSTTVTIQDNEGPIIADIPDQIITSGTNTSFLCNVTGGDIISYSWMKDGSPLSDGTQLSSSVVMGSGNDTLTIVSVQDGDGGGYSCNAGNGQGTTISNSSMLTVVDLSVISVQDGSFTIGTIADLRCDASSSDSDVVTVEWMREDGEPFDDTRTASTPFELDPRIVDLDILNVGVEDEGMYTCIATNPDGVSTSKSVMLNVTGLPEIISVFTPITEREYGQQFSLSCVAKNGASNDLTFVWSKNEDTLTADSVRVMIVDDAEDNNIAASALTITSLVFSDAANYTCLVHNREPEDGVTRTTELTVTADPPIITDPTQPEDQINVIPGDNVIFTVVANGTDLMYQWQRNGIELTDEGRFSGTSTSTLTITDVQEENEGMYQVIVSNIIGNDTSRVAQLTVYDPPTITNQTQPEDQLEVTPGDNVIFTVVANGTELMYQWQRNGSDLTDGGRFSDTTTSALIIMAVQEDDEDTYQCIVSNIVGNETSSAAQLTVLDPPTITVEPLNLTNSIPGNGVTFTIAATGQFLSYSWQLNEEPLTIDPRHSGADSAELSITAVRESDEGSYRCNVSNAAGSVVSNNAYLTVIDPPTIVNATQLEDQLEATPGDNITFTVVAAGDLLMYTWQRNTVSLLDMGKFSGTNTSTLTITDVREEEEGMYRCVVSNIIRNVTSRVAQLTVFNPPEITQDPVSMNATGGANVTFTCVATGLGSLTATWTTTASTTLPDSTETLDNNTITSTLVLTSVGAIDGGDYTCEITNEAGSVNATGTLYIIPLIVTQPMDVLTVVGVVEELSCFAEGFPEPVYQWQKQNASTGLYVNIQNANESVLDISPLAFGDGGTYQCVASNVAGMAISNPATVYITPLIVTQPMDIGADNGTMTQLTCQADGFPEPTYQWQKLDEDDSGSGTDILGAYVDLPNVTSSMLEFTPVEFGDEGSYRCVASSMVGQATSEPATLSVSPEGSVMVLPLNEVFNSRDNVTFNCSAMGGPDNTYQWLRNKTTLEDEISDSLTFTSINASIGNEYTCVVSNDAGNSSARSFLYVSPEIVLSPSDRNATNGTTVIMLMCDAEAFPEAQYSWVYDNGVIGDNIVTMENYLTFSPVLFGDEGDYYCTATSNNITVESERATITVSPEGSVTISPSPVIAEFEETVSLTCSAQGGPGNTIAWQHGTELLVNQTYQILDIAVSSTAVGGEYTCTVTNAAGSESATATLYITPRITVQPQDIQTRNGTTESFTCDAEGFPTPLYRWEMLQPFNSGTPVTIDGNGSVYVFNPVVFGDEGNYSCVAFLNISGSQSETSSRIATLTISPKGSVVASPPVFNAARTNMVEFTCTALGGPGNTFTWTRELDGRVVSLDQTLLIPFPNAYDGSTYACSVENEAGNETVAVILNVAPLVLTPPTPMNVTSFQDNITLICNASGFPIPRISWTHNETVVNASDRIIIMENPLSRSIMSTLTVVMAMTNDSGSYACNATSIDGVFTEDIGGPVTVLVQDRPEQPQNVSAVEVNSRNITLVWVEPHDNNAPIQGYRVMYQRPSFLGGTDEIVNASIEMEVITGLQPGVTYNFTVVAFNEIDDSDPSEVLPVSTLEEEPGAPPEQVEAFTINSTAILVSWQDVPAIIQNGIITQYEVEYNQSRFAQVPMSDTTIVNASQLTVELTDLEEDMEYSIRVRAYTSVGPGPFSAVVMNRTFEDVPSNYTQNVQALTISSTMIRVTWEEVPDIDQNGDIILYEVQYEPLETFGGMLMVETANISNSSILEVVLMDLEEYVDYNITIRAYTSVGPGPSSPVVMNRTFEDLPAESPQNVVVTVLSSTEIRVSWQDVPAISQNGIITQYEVEYNQSRFAQVPMSDTTVVNASQLTVELTDLEEDVEYSISVRAYTSVGPGPFSAAIANTTFEDVPSNYTQNVQAITISSTMIRITWEEVPEIDQNGDIILYEVQYEPLETFGGTLMVETVNISNSSILEVVLMDLEEFVDYNITIRAYTSVGPGPSSPIVMNRTFEDLPAESPQNVVVTVLSSTEIRVSWQDVPAIIQNGIITQYEVEYNQSRFAQVPMSDTTIVNASQLTVELTALEEDVEYSISVRAFTSVGPGPFSAAIANTTFEDVPSNYTQNVQAITISSTMIRVTWEEVPEIGQNGDIILYEVQYEPLETFGGELMVETANISNSSILEVVLMDLEEYVDYNITIRAYTSVGPGPSSPVVMNRTFEDLPAEPPQNVVVTVLSSTEIRVSWQDVPAISQNGIITQYEVEYNQSRFAQVPMSDTTVVNASQLTVELTDLEEDVEYSISVRAYTSVGPGPFSAAIANTTFEDVPSNYTQNVQAITISSTMIRITWEEVPEIDQNGDIILYEVQYEPLETFGGTLMVETVNISNSSILEVVLMDLEEFVDYNITIRAYTSVGPGPSSPIVMNRTFEDLPAESPQNVVVTVLSSTEIRVSWQDVPAIIQNGIITQYEVEYNQSRFAQVPMSDTTIVNASQLTVELTALEEDVEYSISVRAFTSVGPGPFSAAIANTTFEDVPSNYTQNVQAITISSTMIRVTWEEVPEIGQNGDIILYEVQYEPLETFGGELMVETANISNSSILEVVLMDLQEYVDYNITIRAYTRAGPGPYSPVVMNRTFEDRPAEPPQNVVVTVLSSTEIRVSWQDVPAISQNGIITQYEVEYNQSRFAQVPMSDTTIVNASQLTVELTDLEEDVEYSIRVRAYTSVGPGPFSAVVMNRTFEDVPSNYTQNVQAITNSSTMIRVTWEEVPDIDQNGDIILYEVQYEPLETFGGVLMVETANVSNSSILEVVLMDLEEYVDYNITIRAYTSAGPGPSSPVVMNRTFEDLPAEPPQNVVVTVLSSTEIRVSWQDVPAISQNGIITQYEVEYNQSRFAQVPMGDTTIVNASQLTVELTDLEEDVEYSIRVRAFTSVGPGPFSAAIANTTFEDVPSNYTQNVQAITISSTMIQVTWEEVPEIDQNGDIILYEVQYEPLETFGGMLMVETANVSNSSILEVVLMDLEEYVDYNITIRAYTSAGPGPSSPVVMNRTFEDLPVATPVNLTVETAGPNELDVSWERPEEININGELRFYIIQYQIVDQANSTNMTVNVSGNTLSTTLEGLNNFTNYTVSVAAYTIDTGPFTSELESTAENVPGMPPQDVQGMPLSSTTISVEWDSPPEEVLYGILRGYRIRYVPMDGTNTPNFEMTGRLITSTTLVNLSEFTNYSIEVTAITIDDGPYSDPIFIRTDPDVPGNVPRPPEPSPNDTISSTSVTVRWNPPSDPNGEITNYTVNFVATSSTPVSRRKRQAAELRVECIRGGEDNVDRDIIVEGNPPNTFVTLDDLTPYSTYEFSVQAATRVGPGAFSPSQTFSTPEDVPTEPLNLTVSYINATALDIAWREPLCDYGIRTNYTVEYEVVPGTEGDLGTPGSPHGLAADATALMITELTPNTNYSVTVYASTSAGAGMEAIKVGQTDEDAPSVVAQLVVTSSLSSDLGNQVIVTVIWEPPSDRNGPFNYSLTYSAEQLPPYPEGRRNSTADSQILTGDQNQYIINNGLPFANYTVTIYAFNIKRTLPGPSESAEHRSLALKPTAVTNLAAVATDFDSILVTWDLPLFPNGPISHYILYYIESDEVQEPPIISSGYINKQVDAPTTELEISELVPYTNYTFHVQPYGGPSLPGDIDEEVLQRTQSTTPSTIMEPSTDEPTDEATTNTIFIYLPSTSQFDTGPLIFYGVVVVDTTGIDFQNSQPDQATFNDAEAYDATDPEQTYYITAAWDDASRVPEYFIVGNGSTTVVQLVTYLNARLAFNRGYAIFYQVRIQSDTDEELVVNSDYVIVRTAEEDSSSDLGYDPAGLSVGIIVIILFIAVVVILVIILVYWWKTKRYKNLVEGEVAFEQTGVPLQAIYTNPGIKSYSTSQEPILVEEFARHVHHMHANDDYSFSEEYNSVEPNHTPTTEATLSQYNTAKNRYANIPSYDHSRVKLHEIPGRPGSDYINANHIHGYQQTNAYIATQGPVPDSIADFWRMIWEQGSASIIMLTNLEERGRLKCHKYWPDEKSALYGLIRVHIQEVLVLADYTVRTFSLQREGSREERIVTQYHFTVWPDHGVPQYPTSLLHFVRKVSSCNPINAGPIIVHCSAGVGRTGTFMTLHSQLRRIKAEATVNVFGFVRSMRYQRCNMVQTEPQYIFLHDALLEAIECGVTEVAARDLRDQYRMVMEMDKNTGRTRLQDEYKKLDSTIHRYGPKNTATLPVNKFKNRYARPELFPYDNSRCRLSFFPGVEGSDYINASHIDGYHKRRAFIATQGPLPDTTEDLWRMLWEQKSSTIVMLTKVKEGGRVRCHRYWPESGAETYGQYQVILHSVNEYPDYILREFKIVDTKDGSSLPVKQFQYSEWPEEAVPDTGTGLIDLIGQVQKWQRSSGDKPIVVHCSGGCGRTGTFIAIDCLLERLKTEGVVDVFHTVRGLRLQRPGMVQSIDQYEFCYRTVLEYLDSFELYANFK